MTAMQRLAPYLFGVPAYLMVRLHSHAPAQTLATLAWCLLGLGVSLLVMLGIRGRRLRVSRPVGWLLFALTASMIASNMLLSDLFWSLPLLGVYIADVLLALAVYLLYRQGPEIPIGGFCIAIGLVHLPYLVETVLWVIQVGPPFFTRTARIANFAHVRHFGYLGFLAAISGSALLALSRKFRLASFLFAFSAVFGMILTGSRGALLSWMFFAALLVAFFPDLRRRVVLHALGVFVGSAMLVAGLHYSGLLVSPNLFARTAAIVDGTNPFDSGRLDIWIAALQEIAKRPMFGFGTEAYQLSGCCDRLVAQPHNFILQLLMQFGLVGNALLVALAWRAVRFLGGPRAVIAQARATPQALLLVAMLAAYLAFGLIDGLLYQPVPLLHFALFCGLLAAALPGARLSVREAPPPPPHR